MLLMVLDHVVKKAKYEKTEEPHHWKQTGKHHKKNKKRSSVKSLENVASSSVKQQASSSDIPRLPHSPAAVSANWKQLIQV